MPPAPYGLLYAPSSLDVVSFQSSSNPVRFLAIIRFWTSSTSLSSRASCLRSSARKSNPTMPLSSTRTTWHGSSPIRITSYNVCYTKLLRAIALLERHVVHAAGFGGEGRTKIVLIARTIVHAALLRGTSAAPVAAALIGVGTTLPATGTCSGSCSGT